MRPKVDRSTRDRSAPRSAQAVARRAVYGQRRAALVRPRFDGLPTARGFAPHSTVDPSLPLGPYLDYSMWLTGEGGFAVRYKHYDRRLRRILMAWALFLSATFIEACWVMQGLRPPLLAALLLVGAGAILNAIIFLRPAEVFGTIEIRPDCLILDGSDVFFAKYMQNGPPTFTQNDRGEMVLAGIYGTRHIEYLSIPRFDEYDRAPEAMAAHLRVAMKQLWERPF